MVLPNEDRISVTPSQNSECTYFMNNSLPVCVVDDQNNTRTTTRKQVKIFSMYNIIPLRYCSTWS